MTDSEKELVNRLRAWADPVESGYEIPAAGRSMREAADAIERLVRERDEANLHVAALLESNRILTRERDDARAERDRDCIALGLEIKALRNDAEAAEVEVEKLKVTMSANAGLHKLALDEVARLREALTFYGKIENWWSPTKRSFALQYDPEPSPIQKDRGKLSRAALEAKHD